MPQVMERFRRHTFNGLEHLKRNAVRGFYSVFRTTFARGSRSDVGKSRQRTRYVQGRPAGTAKRRQEE
jgi:hypothetical protein